MDISQVVGLADVRGCLFLRSNSLLGYPRKRTYLRLVRRRVDWETGTLTTALDRSRYRRDQSGPN